MTHPLTDKAVEAGARALREHDMAGRITVPWDRMPNAQKRKWQKKARAILSALAAEGLVVVPREPSRGLLISMAIRMDHAFVAPPQEIGAMKLGYDDGYREVVLGDLRKAYEEVVGDGFYSAEREDNYRAIAPRPLSPLSLARASAP